MMQQAYGVDLMDIAAGGFLDSSTTNWIQDRTQALMSTVSATTAGWFNKARTFYQTISETDAVQALRNLTAKADLSWKGNNIHLCTSIEQIQASNPVLQRYLMAEPNLRQLYLNQSCEGFAGVYNNVHGNAVGVNHYDYRRVTDGMLLVTESQVEWNDFYELIPDNDKELELYEKADMIRNWNLVNIALDANEMDPSSPIGNLL
jgi:hypothetical protein